MKPSIADVSEHAAVRAWHQISKSGNSPQAIEVLKEHKNSSVYRFVGLGIVAKLTRLEKGLVERAIYEDILPNLPISAPRLYGFLREEDSDFCWLFIEDTAGLECSFENVEHRELISRWTAQLHVSAARRFASSGLPSRNLDHFASELKNARLAIRENIGNPFFTAADHGYLEATIGLYNELELQWTKIMERCSGIPETLVHNDLAPKNVHIRSGRNGHSLYVIDWEYSGWGTPAADLGNLDLKAYREISGTDPAALEWLSSLGRLLRSISSAGWASTRFEFESETAQRGMTKLRFSIAGMRDALAEIRLS